MITSRKRSLLWIAALSLAVAYPGLTAMAQTSASASSDGDGHKATSTSRSVSFSEDGKTVSISDNSRSGITVTITETVDGQPKKSVTKAANAAELAKKNPAAYELYQKHLGGKGAKASANVSGHTSGGKISKNAKASASSNSTSGGTADKGSASEGDTTEAPSNDAKEMLRKQLREMREKNADNPAMAKVIDDALRQVDEDK